MVIGCLSSVQQMNCDWYGQRGNENLLQISFQCKTQDFLASRAHLYDLIHEFIMAIIKCGRSRLPSSQI